MKLVILDFDKETVHLIELDGNDWSERSIRNEIRNRRFNVNKVKYMYGQEIELENEW